MEEQQILKQLTDLKNAKIYLEDIHKRYLSTCNDIRIAHHPGDHDDTIRRIDKELNSIRLNLARIRDE